MRTRAAARRIVCVLFYGKQRAGGDIPHNKLKEATGCARVLARDAGRERWQAAGGRSRGWVTPLGCSSPPTSWSTERVVRRYRTGKSRFYPPQPESSPPSSAFSQVGNCHPFAFLAFNSAQLAQLTTNSGVCSMRPPKRIAHPSFPPSGTHDTSPKVSRNEKRRAPEIGAA